ncbi:MAG TPA: DUF58 domain-containing protein [Ktedonobacteraceae bacterium]
MNRRWYFACAGVILLALLVRQPLIMLIGLLALLVLGAVDIWATYCLTNLRFERKLSEKYAAFGEEITLSFTVENAKLLPLPWLEVEDNVPRALPIRDRQVRLNPTTNRALLESLFSTRWYERITRSYTLLCHARGVHMFGPTNLRSGDLFGFTEQTQTLENRQYLLVHPLIRPLSKFNLPARHPFGERRAPRRLLEDPSRVIGVRDYAYGDELRRIHWKATARTLQLQSKIYEPTTTYTLVTFLNISTQFNAYFNPYPELLELSVCAAASVANWALNTGYAVGLYSNGFPYVPEQGMTQPASPESVTSQAEVAESWTPSPLSQLKQRRVRLPPASSSEQYRRIMDALARVQSFFNGAIEEMIQSERTHLPPGTTIVVITCTISEPLLDTLQRLRQSGHAVTILLVSEQPLANQLAGIPLHHLGGTETWKNLLTCYNQPEGDQQKTREAQKIALTAFHF